MEKPGVASSYAAPCTGAGARRNHQRKRQRHLLRLRAGLIQWGNRGSSNSSDNVSGGSVSLMVDPFCSMVFSTFLTSGPSYDDSNCAAVNFCGDQVLLTATPADEYPSDDLIDDRSLVFPSADSKVAAVDYCGDQVVFTATPADEYPSDDPIVDRSVVFPSADSICAAVDDCGDQVLFTATPADEDPNDDPIDDRSLVFPSADNNFAAVDFCGNQFAATPAVKWQVVSGNWERAHVVSGRSDKQARAHVVSGRVCSNSNIAAVEYCGDQLFARTPADEYPNDDPIDDRSFVFPFADSNLAAVDVCGDQFLAATPAEEYPSDDPIDDRSLVVPSADSNCAAVDFCGNQVLFAATPADIEYPNESSRLEIERLELFCERVAFAPDSCSAWDLPPNPTQADVAAAAAAAAATAATYKPSRAARRGLCTSGYVRKR